MDRRRFISSALSWTAFILLPSGGRPVKIAKEQQNALDQKLLWFCERGHLWKVKELILSGANPNASLTHPVFNTEHVTPLMIASANNHRSVVRYLLRSGAEVSARDEYLWTALFYAVGNGHVNVVTTLIDNGASCRVADLWGATPLHHAALRLGTNSNLMRYLVSAGGSLDVIDRSGNTPFFYAAMCRDRKAEV
jgi:ankyrin repeat protein